MGDDRPTKFTDSYLTSTISATSGLGSNYTTNTSGSGSTQLFTPSPRRKTSATSFSDVNELPETELSDGRASAFVPSNYLDCRVQAQQEKFFHYQDAQLPRQYYANDDLAQNQRGYFGKLANYLPSRKRAFRPLRKQ